LRISIIIHGRYLARLQFIFLGSDKTSLLEFDHHPQFDAPRTWKISGPSTATYTRCELKLLGTTGELTRLEFSCAATSLIITVENEGLTITSSNAAVPSFHRFRR
jgi:hypothetical protein